MAGLLLFCHLRTSRGGSPSSGWRQLLRLKHFTTFGIETNDGVHLLFPVHGEKVARRVG